MFFLSWRQLIAKKKQTILILLGISLAALLFILISGLQLGLRSYIAEQLLNNTAHVLITGADRNIDAAEVTERFFPNGAVHWIALPSGKREEARLENYQAWYRLLSGDSEVVDFSPRLTTNAVLSNGNFNASVSLVGTVPERHLRITSIGQYMAEGSFAALKGGNNNIVIGSEVAKNLGTAVGKYIIVNSGRGSKSFKVVGIVRFGNDNIDKSIAFAGLNNVQTLTKTPGRVSDIAVALYDIGKSKAIAENWKLMGREKVEDWQAANKLFMEMIKFQDYVRYFITAAILIVASFGIYNVLTIMINQKRREIAILRAIGYTPKSILQLVLYQGSLLGVVGGVLGVILGYVLCVVVGRIDFGFQIGGSNTLRISYDWQIYATAFIASNVAAIFAAALPAYSASRMTPMEIIRSDS